jgi:hypothetical protein
VNRYVFFPLLAQAFVIEMQKRIVKEKDDINIPKQQKRPVAKLLTELAAK